jgi:dTDP-4-dehydrorhamnose reductase
MSRQSRFPELELWAGIECTCNRVGNTYMDQLSRNGHALREDDLSLFADLGIKAIRYPVLWERTAPRGVNTADWSWADARLARLKQLRVRPIVGLVHHGSGPENTQIDSPSFSSGIKEYAAAVARRYPWIDYYTPVNEPLTTARFSCLYGHWYPHRRDDLSFAQALLNQCKATVLAIREIRKINPGAKLVQTEDLGKTYSTPALAYQADFENERRWVTFDLLCGQLTADKPMWHFLRSVGIDRGELDWFIDNPCPPYIMGLNHYVIGERLIDERIDRYPSWTHGGNGLHNYADVEAVRVLAEGIAGWVGLMREAWNRFNLPLAMTEVHLNCHREAQLAWLLEAWQAAEQLRAEDVDVRAVTAWSLLGSYNWSTLVTCDVGDYESGVFDVGNGRPRPTAIAQLMLTLARGDRRVHPAVHESGWWRRPTRLLYKPASVAVSHTRDQPNTEQKTGPPLLIAGGNGTLGQAFVQACQQRELTHIVTTRQDLDVTDGTSIQRSIAKYRPWAIVNATGYVRVDQAEEEAEQCHRTNTRGAVNLAETCNYFDVQLITFSSDLVFSGEQQVPYVEADSVAPLNVYGHSKVAAERDVLAAFPRALVIRTSAFFGPWDRYNFLAATLARLERRIPVRAAEDWLVSPTYLPDLVNRCLDLLIDNATGIWHLANEGTTSWADFARQAAVVSGLDSSCVRGCRGASLGLPARRPTFSVLGSQRGRLLPPLEDGVRRFCEARYTRQSAPLATLELSGAEGVLSCH